MNDVELGLSFLLAQSAVSVMAVFWYTLIFELPRYVLPFVAAGLTCRSPSGMGYRAHPVTADGVSVILIGHNEQDSLEACVRSLREQSFNDFEIVIVSDGSTDRMSKVARELVRKGLADSIITTDIRGGKPSGINLASRFAKGNFIINVDCDCSFDRFAIENLLRPFADPTVGATCGDIAPRNGHASTVAQFQEIEYLQSISVGKRISHVMDQVVCASGAFGAFRKEALEAVGGFDCGGGEDLDVTMRLRQAGWRIAYAADAICYTDVPTSAWQYIRQRIRWERDSIWLRYRKHRRLLNPFGGKFLGAETFHQWDFLLFSVVGAIVFPLYLIWIFVQYGAFAPVILIGMQIGLFLLDAFMLAISAWTTGRDVFWKNLIFLPGYSLFMTYLMRPVRLLAYIDEWVFSGSHRDNYTPLKVRLERPW